MMKKVLFLLCLWLCAAQAQNLAPVASAGIDQTITLPINYATLLGSGSDADGHIVSFAWTKISGRGSAMQFLNTAITNVASLTAGVHVYRLTVTDNQGAIGIDDVQITVVTKEKKE